MSQGRKRSQADMPTVVPNKYEQQSLLNIQANKRKLESLNIKHIATSLSSLVDSTMEKKRKGKHASTIDEDEDEDYEPNVSEEDEFLVKETAKSTKLDAAKKKKQAQIKGSKRGIYIQPQLLANLLKMNTRQQRAVTKEVEAANKKAEEARKDAETAKKEAEATRNEVDEKIAANNKIWEEKFAQLFKVHGMGSSRQG